MQQHTTMSRNPTFQARHHVDAASQWPEEPEERQIGVDPFSLRQFSRLDIDRPLPIPSVSFDGGQHLPVPARLASACASEASSAAASPSRELAPTRWDAHLALAHEVAATCPDRALSGNKSCADGEAELGGDEFDRRASAPQRWGSDVPLIAGARGKDDGRRKGGHGDGAPFGCCLYLPGITRRSKPVPAAPAVRRALSGSGKFRTAAVDESDCDVPGTARPSTMSVAVSLERFECGFSSRSSGLLSLDGEASPPYFDLPLELLLGCDGDEADLPVNAAFMFDSDGIRKSVLRKGVDRAAARPSLGKVSIDESVAGRISARQVRFSVTSGSPPHVDGIVGVSWPAVDFEHLAEP